jgi:hypothetical protein
MTIRTVDATLLNIMECLVVDVRIVEHGFGRYAPDVQACSTKGPTLLYTCSLGGERVHGLRKGRRQQSRRYLETELSGLNGSHVSTRSCNKNALI